MHYLNARKNKPPLSDPMVLHELSVSFGFFIGAKFRCVTSRINVRIYECSGRDLNPGPGLERPVYLTGLYYRSDSAIIFVIVHKLSISFKSLIFLQKLQNSLKYYAIMTKP